MKSTLKNENTPGGRTFKVTMDKDAAQQMIEEVQA